MQPVFPSGNRTYSILCLPARRGRKLRTSGRQEAGTRPTGTAHRGAIFGDPVLWRGGASGSPQPAPNPRTRDVSAVVVSRRLKLRGPGLVRGVPRPATLTSTHQPLRGSVRRGIGARRGSSGPPLGDRRGVTCMERQLRSRHVSWATTQTEETIHGHGVSESVTCGSTCVPGRWAEGLSPRACECDPIWK